VKDVHTVLRQREQDIKRVRKEIQSLLLVIPLLADDEPSCDIMQPLLESFRSMEDSSDHDMALMEIYYPFISNMRAQGRLE